MEERVLKSGKHRRSLPVLWMIVATVGVIVLVGACGAGDPYVSVIEGNYAFGQGRYQDATVRYLQALSRGSYSDWISYDLGNVYHSLGESDAALQMWKRASHSADSSLRFGVAFNQGVQFYELGDYPEAYASFRRALEFDSSNINAKINLELTLQKLQPTAESPSTQQPVPPKTPEITNQDSQRVLDYVRRKEAQEWAPGKTKPPQPAANDW